MKRVCIERGCHLYPWPHVHYPDWLRMGDSVQVCRPKDGSVCGKHVWRISVENVLQAWKYAHPA